jgi:MFS family permease
VALTTQYGLYLILTWLPFYLQESRGFSGQLASAASTLMPLAAAPSGMLVGWLSDRAGRRKKLALWLVPLSTAAIGAIGMTRGNALLLVGLFLYGMTGKLVLDPVLVAMVSDRVASHARAGALGVLNLASTISMVSAPALTGYLADVTKSFRASFWVAIVLGVLASVLLAFVREEETATS